MAVQAWRCRSKHTHAFFKCCSMPQALCRCALRRRQACCSTAPRARNKNVAPLFTHVSHPNCVKLHAIIWRCCIQRRLPPAIMLRRKGGDCCWSTEVPRAADAAGIALMQICGRIQFVWLLKVCLHAVHCSSADCEKPFANCSTQAERR